MRPLGVIEDEQGVEVGLEPLDAVAAGVTHATRKNSSSTAPLKRSTKPWLRGRSDPWCAVLDAVEVEIEPGYPMAIGCPSTLSSSCAMKRPIQSLDWASFIRVGRIAYRRRVRCEAEFPAWPERRRPTMRDVLKSPPLPGRAIPRQSAA